MDIHIFTADPDAIDVDEIREALEALEYNVAQIVIVERFVP